MRQLKLLTRTTLSFFCLVGASRALAAAPAPAAKPAAQAAATATPLEDIKIGLMLPISGNEAGETKSLRRSADLAIRDINGSGGVRGRKLKLVPIDTQSGPVTALAAYEKLAGEEKVTAIVGPWKSAQIVAMIPAMKRIALPTMIGGTNPRLTEDGLWFFRTRPDDTIAAKAMVEYLKDATKFKKIGLIHDKGAFGMTGANLVEKHVAGTDLQIVKRLGTELGQTDFSKEMKAVKDAGAEIVVVYLANIGDSASAIREWAKIGKPFAFLGSPSLSNAGVSEELKGLSDGVSAVADFAYGQSPVDAKYSAAYEAEYHEKAETIPAYIYDSITILADTMKSVGTDPNKIREAIMKIDGYQGVCGKYKFAPLGNGLHSVTIIKIDGGKLKALKMVSPQ